MTGPTTTPERAPTRSLRVELTSLDGVDTSLVLVREGFMAGVGEYNPVQLHPFEYTLLNHLATYPDAAFKPAMLRRAMPVFADKYAPQPSELMKELIRLLPVLEPHLISVVNGQTQFFGLLDTAGAPESFHENVKRLIERDTEAYANPRRRAKTLGVVAAAVTAFTTTVGVAGYLHRKHTNTND
ncbi:MAG: hypothetical protein JWO47_534 [Candidatus Saccharibacteria bacterium]|nr:hypothetical protein [Candidatus Saccharibacteria bacterium]